MKSDHCEPQLHFLVAVYEINSEIILQMDPPGDVLFWCKVHFLESNCALGFIRSCESHPFLLSRAMPAHWW